MVRKERSLYRAVCNSTKTSIHDLFKEGDTFAPPGPGVLRSNDAEAHYSFDIAQQVHYPYDPFQPGLIYFLTPRKCPIFGVCCEGIPRQVNYLIDEASGTGKGANSIVSMLHHFFGEHGLGEDNVKLHADNCVGQNKNNTMLHYLIWRVMVGLHKTITLSFLVVGHTKFSLDWCFGLVKQRFRRSKFGCLEDLVRVVESSATPNISQLVGTQEGETLVPTYDWAGMFPGHLRKLKNIKSYRHFRVDSSTPGVVHVKVASDSTEKSISLVVDDDWVPSSSSLPELVVPLGLSLERQWYLRNSIAEYCPEEVRDRVCPEPTTTLSAADAAKATGPQISSSSGEPPTSSSSGEPPTKKARLCSKCRQPGHTVRTCNL